MSNQGQGLLSHLYVVCLYEAQISDERLQDHWSSGSLYYTERAFVTYYLWVIFIQGILVDLEILVLTINCTFNMLIV